MNKLKKKLKNMTIWNLNSNLQHFARRMNFWKLGYDVLYLQLTNRIQSNCDCFIGCLSINGFVNLLLQLLFNDQHSYQLIDSSFNRTMFVTTNTLSDDDSCNYYWCRSVYRIIYMRSCIVLLKIFKVTVSLLY